ncbi:hypothetical protein [uncultured Rhodoblastus sp.]|uniref:hypothetical protein n=1 Tax=uncultured Rhodoblastus sp. TaxID=543037 RepID=UPI0025F8E713|nr:hypothetical protein [uncultured Rhodoblastus sp.]
MCDYSLEMYSSRPAREGEIYVTTRFPSGSIGMAAPGDCTTAVCVSYGTRLRLENLPIELQQTLGVAALEDVVFTRLDSGLHHDGVKFANGAEMPLHRMGSGVLVSLIDAEKPAVRETARQAATELEPAE